MSSTLPQMSGMTSIPETQSVDSREVEIAAQITRSTPSLRRARVRLAPLSRRFEALMTVPSRMSKTRIDLATSKTGDTRPFHTGIAILMATRSLQPWCQRLLVERCTDETRRLSAPGSSGLGSRGIQGSESHLNQARRRAKRAASLRSVSPHTRGGHHGTGRVTRGGHDPQRPPVAWEMQTGKVGGGSCEWQFR